MKLDVRGFNTNDFIMKNYKAHFINNHPVTDHYVTCLFDVCILCSKIVDKRFKQIVYDALAVTFIKCD